MDDCQLTPSCWDEGQRSHANGWNNNVSSSTKYRGYSKHYMYYPDRILIGENYLNIYRLKCRLSLISISMNLKPLNMSYFPLLYTLGFSNEPRYLSERISFGAEASQKNGRHGEHFTFLK